MRGRKQFWNLLGFLLILTAFLTACGNKESSYVYVAEKLPLSGYVSNFKILDGYLYYKADQAVYRIPITELLEQKSLSSSREAVFTGDTNGGSLFAYTLDSAGKRYYLLMDKTWKGEIQWSALVRQQMDGTEDYRLDLNGMDISGCSLAADDRGRAFLLAGDYLYVADAEGKLLAEIPGSKLGTEFYSGRGSLLEGEDGSVYFVPFSGAANVIYEISGNDAAFREESFQMKRIETPSANGYCYSSQQGILYSGFDGLLYRFQKEQSSWESVLRFGDSNLQWQPKQMVLLSEEYMVAYYDYPDRELYFLTKTDASLLPEQRELTLALCGQLLPDLEKYIVAFNQDSGYHVTAEYINWENIASLDASLLTSDAPDLILYTDNEDVLKYAQKGLLEDLGAYLDKSTVLDRDDFLESIVEAYTIDGRLVCIPKDFSVRTVLGRTSQTGTAAGWTAKEVMAFVEAHPESPLFKTPTITSMVAFFWEDILERYIDWESGECSFDSEEFRTFVKWMEAHSDGFGNGIAGSGGDSWNNGNERFPKNQLLWLDAHLYDFYYIPQYEMCFGENITPVGYPSYDGRPLHTAYVYNAISIPVKSGNKEIAWQFIEGYLSEEKWNQYRVTLSTQKNRLIKKAENEISIVYERDGDGEISLYKAGEHKGEPVMREKGWIYFEGESIPYYYLTQEQVDTVLEMIENIDFTPNRREGVRYDVISILLEELGPYIEGQRSLEESTRILQNRARNLVQENL